MRYLVLIYDENTANPPTEPPDMAVIGPVMEAYNAYSQMLRDRGAFVAGEALQPVTTATTIRVRDGQTLTTDGPFVSVKEALGGYFLYETDDLDAAIELASRVPAARMGGAVEVRPVAEW